MTATTHGGTQPIPPEALLADDPELWLAWADMGAHMDAHPCSCTDDDGVCLCNEETEEP